MEVNTVSKKNKIKPLKRIKPKGDCFNCGNCVYHSQGDSYCEENFDFVLEDWCPSDKYRWCNR